MEQTLAPKLDDRLYNMIFQDHSPSAARRFITGSQRAAVPKLRQLYQVGMMQQSFAGIAPRTKPLLVGASGCGKSATVRLLAQELDVETLTVNAGSWIVYGAKNDNYTIQQIRDFVCRQWQRGGLIFIDELDKCVPHDTARMDSWSQSVFTELLAVLDADKRLLAMSWNEDMLTAFASGLFMVIGAGAWQHLNKQANARTVGFAEMKVANYGELIQKNFGIPEEIGRRFCQDLLLIEPPTERDFYDAIKLIHADGDTPVPAEADCQRLARAACESNYGVRWLENYALTLLQNRAEYRQPPKLPEQPNLPVSSDWHSDYNKFNELLLTLRETAGRLSDRLRGQPYHGPDTALRELLHDDPFLPTILSTVNSMTVSIAKWFSTADSAFERRRHAEEIYMRELREAERLLDELRLRFARPLMVTGLSKIIRELHDQCFRVHVTYDRLLKSNTAK